MGIDDGYHHGPLGSKALTATRCSDRSSLGGDVLPAVSESAAFDPLDYG